MDQDSILALSSLLLLLAPCFLHKHAHNCGTDIFYVVQLSDYILTSFSDRKGFFTHIEKTAHFATLVALLYTKKLINTLGTGQ